MTSSEREYLNFRPQVPKPRKLDKLLILQSL
jgi:hypothetical protein